MADKLTHLITDALTRLAAEPGGLALYTSKSDAGLFPNTAAAKPAAQKCLADELVRPTAPEAKRYALTEKGWEFLLAAVNPKQVLEDFVRVLESRQGEVGELLVTARRMADNLQGLKDAVARVLPTVSATRVQPTAPAPLPVCEGELKGPPATSLKGAFLSCPSPLAGEGGGSSSRVRGEPSAGVELRGTTVLSAPSPAGETPAPSPARGEGQDLSSRPSERAGAVGLCAPPASLASVIVAHLRERRAATDCPLPELFRAAAQTAALTIGEFHDCLRQLHADGAVSLPAWTGPLYAVPEPQYALLIGHGIAYYASLKG